MVIGVEQVFRELAIGFTFGLIFFKFMLAGIFYYSYHKQEKQNRMLLGMSLFFFFLALSRIFMMIFDFYLTEFNTGLFQLFSPVWKIGSILSLIGFGFFFLIADHNLFHGRDKYIFTILYAVLGAIPMIIPFIEISEALSAITIVSTVLFIPLSYLYLAIKTSDKIRLKALSVFGGLCLYGAALLIIGEIFLTPLWMIFSPTIQPIIIRYIVHVVSVVLKIASGGLFLYGFR